MKCTSCKSGKLLPAYLEGLFPCVTCSNCGGNLVMLADYLRWRETHQDSEFVRDTKAHIEADEAHDETSRAMICPMTGTIMTKYRISKDIDHRLDLSPTISAIWMDSGEWELLKKSGLAGKLNNIFTDHWQRGIHSAESADILQAMYQRLFGDQYEAVRAFRDNLNEMENRSEVIAYLLADDPYKP